MGFCLSLRTSPSHPTDSQVLKFYQCTYQIRTHNGLLEHQDWSLLLFSFGPRAANVQGKSHLLACKRVVLATCDSDLYQAQGYGPGKLTRWLLRTCDCRAWVLGSTLKNLEACLCMEDYLKSAVSQWASGPGIRDALRDHQCSSDSCDYFRRYAGLWRRGRVGSDQQTISQFAHRGCTAESVGQIMATSLWWCDSHTKRHGRKYVSRPFKLKCRVREDTTADIRNAQLLRFSDRSPHSCLIVTLRFEVPKRPTWATPQHPNFPQLSDSLP